MEYGWAMPVALTRCWWPQRRVSSRLGLSEGSEGEQWDGEMIKNIKGSPKDWRLDVSEDQQMVEWIVQKLEVRAEDI